MNKKNNEKMNLIGNSIGGQTYKSIFSRMLRYKLFGEKTNLRIQSKNYKEEETQKCFLLLFRNLFCLNFVDTGHLFKKTNQSLGFMMSIISCCRKRLLGCQVNLQCKFDILKMPGAVGQGISNRCL